MCRTIFCSRLNAEVPIAECWTCRLLCVDNPNTMMSQHASSDFIRKWGLKEIEKYLEESVKK